MPIKHRRPLRTTVLALALLTAAGVGAGVPVTPADAATSPGELLVYYGWPSLINGAADTSQAAVEFAAYDFVVLGADVELPGHADHDATVAIIAQPALAGTLIFGYINLAATGEPLTLTEVYQRVDWWQAMGVHGILFDAFGYDYEVTRERQNAAVGYVHGLGMPVAANGWFPDDVFGSEVDPVYNPDGLTTQLGAGDYYMSESYFVQLGDYQDYQYWVDKADLLAAYQAQIGFGILSVTTNGPEDVYSQEMHWAAWGAAAEYGHVATGWGEYLFSADDNLAPFRPRPPAMLRVTTSPAVPSQILVDGIPRDTWGLNWMKLPPGDHEVSFTDVPGFTTPAPQTVSVATGLTTEWAGQFVQEGQLRVTTSPPVPSTILVDGVPRNDWGMWTDLPVGSYEVCFGDVPGFTTPACQTAVLTAGQTTIITGSFGAAPAAPPEVTVSGSGPSPLRVMVPTQEVSDRLLRGRRVGLADVITAMDPRAAYSPGPRMPILDMLGQSAGASAVMSPTVFRTLAILVDFSDETSQVSATYFDTLLFGTAGTKTVNRFYDEASYGLLDIVTLSLPSSIGWKRAPQTLAYYVDGRYCTDGIYPHNCRKLAEDVTALVDPVVDFSQYDNDEDGYVDTVFIIHAGQGAEATGSPDDIWSHSWWTVTEPLRDGVRIGSYTTEPEYWLTPGDMTHGVYVHELAHALGLVDLYDYDDSSEGVGNWSLMGSGNWNGTLGDTPAHLDAWSRLYLGFNDAVNVSGTNQLVSLPRVVDNQVGSIYRLDGANANEYWLLENRQQLGSDSALPGAGLLIWHVDTAADSNDNECLAVNNWLCSGAGNHFRVALEQADGLYGLENHSNRGDGGDPFPGTEGNRVFDFTSNPSSSSYYTSTDLEVSVTRISDSAAEMTVWVGELQPGLLRVTTSPPVPSQILVDGVPRDSWGLNWVKLPPGDYEVSFTDVPGFTTPVPQTVTVSPGVTTEWAGLFEARGYLLVNTSPPVPSTILVDGVPRNDWGMWTDLPVGSYEVCFGEVTGFAAPECQTVAVTAGQTTVVTGNFD